MKTKFVALAAVLGTVTAFSPAADAAGGVRLGFGGPLGTFTATPSKGAASRTTHAPGKTETARKRRPAPAVREAAKKPEAPRIPRAERTPDEAKRTDASGIVIAKADVATEEFAPLTGSTALIQSQVPDTGIEGATDATAGRATADASDERAATENTDGTPETPAMCTRFIPAVGMTVTIGCDD